MFNLIPQGGNPGSNFLANMLIDIFNNLLFAPTISLNEGIMSIDIRETKDAYFVQANLPGVTKEGINVEYNNNYLTITANRNEYVENRNGAFIRYQRYVGGIRKSFYIEDVDPSRIDGRFENGVLKLVLPKRKNENK
ncbi:Hsp20/alpha crystallin family protein [Fonticella tunisiensis]|uniref:HSP20 family protein n=1 Tax=Fonticella tunisiensis TaxID=1096341 RepID=A0A4R7KE97_9CLOT|nr:Hsp20/alpha crystallin family protein [Fonticella tunisiensis]TDT51881.1 HSP20 family protein [Fonticella tunisiensis]